MDQQRKDRGHNADLRREDARTGQELVHNRMKAFEE
jgi:hypothetical protein